MSKCNVIFTGDLSLTGIFYKKVKHNDEIFSQTLIEKLKKCDFLVCNLEGPTTNKQNTLRENVKVVSPITSISYLTKRHFNVFNCANNHMFDCGLLGFNDTKNKILSHKSYYFGSGESIEEASKVLYLTKHNITFALIGICHPEGLLASSKDPGVFCDRNYALIKKRVKEARKTADWVIVNYHGGEEYTAIPMPRRRKFLHQLCSLDIDIIIAHHPHVFQGLEKINNTQIFYSLGNFVFDIAAFQNKEFTYESAIVKLSFTNKQYSFEFIPITIDTTNGNVDIGNNNFHDHLESISDFTHYNTLWVNDAHRTFFQPNMKKNSKQKQSNINKGNQKKKIFTILKIMFNPKTYTNIFRILKSTNSRPIFFGAMKYLVIKNMKKGVRAKEKKSK